MPPTPGDARITRRGAALAGLAGSALLATGCTSRGSGGTAPRRTEPDPDLALVTSALAAEQALVDQVEATTRRHPSLRRQLRPTLAVHRSHVRLLAGAAKGGSTPAAGRGRRAHVPGSSTAAIAALARSEGDLRQSHAAAAERAQSGAFARVVAGMAAAAAQQAVALGTRAGWGS